MASVAFGRRSAVQPARGPGPSATSARRVDAAAAKPEVTLQPADVRPAIDRGAGRKVLVGALALLLFAVLLPVSFFSELRRDVALKDSFRPDLSVRVERASCSRYLFLVTNCSVHLSWPDGNGRRTAESSFLVGLRSMGGLRVVPVRSSADSSVVTSSVALEQLSNRAWTLLLVPGTCLLLGALMLMKLLRGRT